MALSRSLVDHRASVVFLIPSHLNALLEPLARAAQSSKGRRLSLRHVVCCGEALRPEVVRSFHAYLGASSSVHAKAKLLRGSSQGGAKEEACELHNLYGPTEGSMTWERCTDIDPPETLIGTPIDDTIVLLLDANLRPAPIGVPAEIFFGGAIAAGYLAQAELTAKRFLANPLAAEMAADPRVPPSPILYRSGDLAMRLPSGSMRFLGRVDRQVKVRGYRIGALPLPSNQAWFQVLVLAPKLATTTPCHYATVFSPPILLFFTPPLDRLFAP